LDTGQRLKMKVESAGYWTEVEDEGRVSRKVQPP
jgi:hypothetical protein